MRPQPILLQRPAATGAGVPDPCASCEARPVSVCAALDERDLHRLAALAVVAEAAPGQAFIEEGDKAEHFCNVTRGAARLYKLLPDGRRQITGFAGPGHFLGLAVSDVYGFTAEAIEPVRYCRFSRSKLRAVLEDFPALERRLLQTAANELVAAQEQMLLLGRKTARERLASFLLARAGAGAGTACGRPTESFRLPMTRQDMADYLGLTIETVSRTVSGFKAEKLIALPTPAEIVLLRRDRLEALAGGYGEPAR